MKSSDPIADLLTRIRNAQRAGFAVVMVPASKMKIAITHILKQEGYVKAYKCIRDGKQGVIKIALKYRDESSRLPVIEKLVRVSTPSCRRYVRADDLPFVRNGFGIGVLSTSKGVMTCRDARKSGIGGEFICSVY